MLAFNPGRFLQLSFRQHLPLLRLSPYCDYHIRHLNNVPPVVQEKIGRQLHLTPHHPLSILRNKIFNFFDGDFVDIFGNKVSFHKVDPSFFSLTRHL
jgi:hypothetical protein